MVLQSVPMKEDIRWEMILRPVTTKHKLEAAADLAPGQLNFPTHSQPQTWHESGKEALAPKYQFYSGSPTFFVQGLAKPGKPYLPPNPKTPLDNSGGLAVGIPSPPPLPPPRPLAAPPPSLESHHNSIHLAKPGKPYLPPNPKQFGRACSRDPFPSKFYSKAKKKTGQNPVKTLSKLCQNSVKTRSKPRQNPGHKPYTISINPKP